MPDTPKKFYLTTPIYYVNARPHIGHAYSTIAADVIARRHRLLGDDTFFLTGTDEHGQKVQRSAEAAGIPPQQFADEVSATFQNLWKRMGITNNDYIRTTDERHRRGVQKLWTLLAARGAIYLSTYTGQYSVGEEMFVEGPPGTIGPDGKPTETVTEENYFFRLSDYQEKLINLIESGELHVQPETVRNEVLSFVRGGLKDLSISRTTFDWGIPVPSSESVILSGAKNPRISPEAPQKSAENHVIYVWLDALANYITAVGYGSDDPADIAKFEKYWPADVHLVGKEITRFHCVYWPAFLMAASLPLPKSVVANGWLLFEESKMSKSRGNVVRTETILDALGPLCPPVPHAASVDEPTPEVVILSEAKNPRISPEAPLPLAAPTKSQQDLFASDVIRYFLLREIPFGQDGSFSFDALITRYNADLANGYGNLVSRTLGLVVQNFSSSEIVGSPRGTARIPPLTLGNDTLAFIYSNDLRAHADTLIGLDLTENDYGFQTKLQRIFDLIQKVDGFITEEKPWKIAAYLKSSTATVHPDPAAQADFEADLRKELVHLECVLYAAAESIRIITALLYPVMPYATASVWRQLGLGSIEEAAAKGELKNLQWGGLKPGTKLGPLTPIFPRADKGLAQIMTDMESPTIPTPASSETPITPASVTEKLVASASAELSLSSTEPAPPTIPDTPQISIDDFIKIDLRVAQIVVAERIPKADKLLRLEVDLGTERRQILSGIAEFYTPEELIGKRIAIIANLAPRKMRGLESHGMLLAASGEDHSSKPILATFSDEIALGSKIR